MVWGRELLLFFSALWNRAKGREKSVQNREFMTRTELDPDICWLFFNGWKTWNWRTSANLSTTWTGMPSGSDRNIMAYISSMRREIIKEVKAKLLWKDQQADQMTLATNRQSGPWVGTLIDNVNELNGTLTRKTHCATKRKAVKRIKTRTSILSVLYFHLSYPKWNHPSRSHTLQPNPGFSLSQGQLVGICSKPCCRTSQSSLGMDEVKPRGFHSRAQNKLTQKHKRN